jgi:hypothetical protein
MGGVSRRGLKAGLLFLILVNVLPAMLTAQAAAFNTFGSGCKGPAGTPKMTAVQNSLPLLGKQFQLSLKSLPDGLYNSVFGVAGLSKTKWKAAQLPMDLGVLGMPGCMMYVSPDHMEAIQKNNGGVATWTMSVPNVSSLVGSTVYLQAWAVDVGANPGAVVVTNAGEAKLGSK